MSKRLMLMLAALPVLALLIMFDRAPAAADAGLAEPVVRAARARPAVAEAPPTEAPPGKTPDASPAFADDAIPDLFASAGPPAAPVARPPAADADAEAPAPYMLLGFKEEDGVREAYLSRQGEVVVARAGAVLNQRYRVLALRQDAVDIRDNQTGASLRLGFGVEP